MFQAFLALCLGIAFAGKAAVAGDVVEEMMNVEGSAQKTTTARPAAITRKTPVSARPVSSVAKRNADSPPTVKVSKHAENTVVSEPAAVTPSVSRELLLTVELRQREQELVKANLEIERLKSIVRRIQEASRREAVILHYNKAGVYRAGMSYKKAEEEYLAAIAIDPEDAAVHYNLAILYDDNLKDKRKAKKHYERFLELAPDDMDAPRVKEWLTSMVQ